MGKDLNRIFIKMDKQQVSTCSTSLAIGQIQSKARIRYHCTPIRMAEINDDQTKCLQKCGAIRPLIYC